MRFITHALLSLLFIALANAACAQYSDDVPAPTVDKIVFEHGKLNNVGEDTIRAHIQLREGSAYDQLLVDRSVRSLYDTGLFDYIQAKTVEKPGNKVDLVFALQCKYRIESIRMSGNDHYPRHRLMKKADVKLMPGGVLDEMNVRKLCDGIRDYYHDKGYAHVKVDYDINRNESTGLGRISIKIDEGRRFKIRKVTFEGNKAFSDKTLRAEIETSRYKWLWSSLSGSGREDPEKLEDDLDNLRTYYTNNGYLDIIIGENDVVVDEDDHGNATIKITVHEGRQYYVGDINVEGSEKINENNITQLLTMIPGDVFSPDKLSKDVESIQNLYGTIGYIDASVRAERVPNLDTGNIDLVYQIDEGDEYKIESIKLDGNSKTMSVVLLREIAMRPGQVFNSIWMKATESRLKNTRFFDDVSVDSEPTNIPGRRNLKVTVHEAPTATLQFGVGFSTTEDGSVFAQYTQGNFDLFNWRSLFQGGGQKFQLSISVGSSSNSTVLAFEEPYFMQQKIGLGFEIYRRENSYVSDYYNTIRTGIDIYIRKMLFERFQGRLQYTLENAKIALVSSYLDSDILAAEEGSKLVSKLGFSLLRDTRNDMLFTTRGSRISLDTEVAGLGGESYYLKVEGRTAFFLPTFQTLDQCLSLLVRAGTAWPLDGGIEVDGVNYGIPIFDRFFLGGPQSLRGFEYHDVGPRDEGNTDDVIGGNSYGFASLEYTFKVSEQFRIAMFYDWGFVNLDSADFDPVLFNDDWGIGIRMLVMNNPLSLDYALPINADDYNDDGAQFNFSFGTRF